MVDDDTGDFVIFFFDILGVLRIRIYRDFEFIKI